MEFKVTKSSLKTLTANLNPRYFLWLLGLEEKCFLSSFLLFIYLFIFKLSCESRRELMSFSVLAGFFQITIKKLGK